MPSVNTVQTETNTPLSHESFTFIKAHKLDTLQVEIQEFEHIKTGAKHFHLQSDSDENVFLVAFKTVPENSNGVAHILEHTSLCGSEAYPVRDPFFMMSRRSINTFMNAFTSSDWTAYPFSSMNTKDFNNLLDVYLDAVFFSRLDPLDFAQEGHRLEFTDPNDSTTPLEYKGVVYNEMKGAMSSVTSQLWHTLTKYLYPSNTYHHNSGGDPQSIPDLTYDELIDFYKTHYHPTNALFMTFGDITANIHQEKFEKQALHRFEKSTQTVSIPNTKRYFAPIQVQESYPLNEANTDNKTHVVLGWLLGQSIDIKHALQAQLVANVLLDNSASPLMHALESSDLGASPSALCGMDDSQKEINFMCGLEGCAVENVQKVEQLIISTLQNVADNGVDQADIESALHQLELHQREVGGDHYPYGLQIILSALNSAIHNGNPIDALDIDFALTQLREDIKDPKFIQTFIQTHLLNNQHRVRLTLSPDTELQARKDLHEKNELAQIKQHLTEQEKAEIVNLAQQLKERQDVIDDETVLPKVTLEDVPVKESSVDPISLTANAKNIKQTLYDAPTNGLCYQQVIYPLPELNEKLINNLPLYSSCITELGLKDLDYVQAQRWQASVTGGVSAFSSIRTQLSDIHTVDGFFTYSGKALNQNHSALTDVLESMICTPRFDESKRLTELVSQIRSHKEQSVTGNGHGLAMMAATSGFCSQANLNHYWGGLGSIQNIKKLDDELKQNGTDSLTETFTALHQAITGNTPELLLITESQHIDQMQPAIDSLPFLTNTNKTTKFALQPTNNHVHDAWLTDSQVNFCAKAYPTVGMTHDDAAALVVLSGLMRNNFLHKAIREQGGAYGGGASQDSSIGAFKFYSYRDPRLEETLTDFDKCIHWAMESHHTNQKIEEAILGVVSSLDRSESPAGKAKRCFYQELHQRNLKVRQTFREQVLAVNEQSIKHVTEKYLLNTNASTVVITDNSKEALVKDLNLNPIKL